MVHNKQFAASMKNLFAFVLAALIMLFASIPALPQGAVVGNSTDNNTTYRDVRIVSRFPLFTATSNQFVISNITSFATQSNLQNSAVTVPTRAIISVGGTLVSDAGGTNTFQWGIAGSINGVFWKTNVYTGSNGYSGTSSVGFFSDVDTNSIYQFIAVSMLNAPTTTNITGSLYYQFRPAP